MDYIKFINRLQQVVKKKLGDQYQVSIQQVLKNNGLTMDSISIQEPNSNISPNIYLDYFYDRFCECESLDEISEEIIYYYHEAIHQKPKDVATYFDFDTYKQKLFFRLVHLEANKALLEQVPHIPYLDLAITFHCLVSDHMMEMQFFTVSNILLKAWGLTINELYQIALDNTQQLFPPHIDTLEHIMEQLLCNAHSYQSDFNNTDFESELSNLPKNMESLMYVITNQYGVNGASVILYPNLLAHLAEKFQSNLYLLPSSIHEFLVLPENYSLYQKLSEMIPKVNKHEVSKDEVLSNHIYFYNWKDNTVTTQVDTPPATRSTLDT